MTILNTNLSTRGFTITPHMLSDGILPEGGLSLCDSDFWRYSPAPKKIGRISDGVAFSAGPDINVGGLTIKRPNSTLVTVPLKLLPFYPVIKACVDNEFACDPHVSDREFAVTITRCDVEAGHASRPHTSHWHRHPPGRLDRAKNIRARRNYVVADNGGTEFIVGNVGCLDLGNRNLAPTTRLLPGELGVFASSTVHRTPILLEGGRRTVLIFISYAPRDEECGSGNPVFDLLEKTQRESWDRLLSLWQRNEEILSRQFKPIQPVRMESSRSLQLCS